MNCDGLSMGCEKLAVKVIRGWPGAGEKPIPVCGTCLARVQAVGSTAGYTFSVEDLPERVRPGLYRHHALNSPPYVVVAVSIMDVHGHGNLDAPRIVTYHSTRSFETGVANSHTEEDFTRPTVWPDGMMRPRFVRIEYQP